LMVDRGVARRSDSARGQPPLCGRRDRVTADDLKRAGRGLPAGRSGRAPQRLSRPSQEATSATSDTYAVSARIAESVFSCSCGRAQMAERIAARSGQPALRWEPGLGPHMGRIRLVNSVGHGTERDVQCSPCVDAASRRRDVAAQRLACCAMSERPVAFHAAPIAVPAARRRVPFPACTLRAWAGVRVYAERGRGIGGRCARVPPDAAGLRAGLRSPPAGTAQPTRTRS
jgi:hypothetical protein